jgi:hypothetical protein
MKQYRFPLYARHPFGWEAAGWHTEDGYVPNEAYKDKHGVLQLHDEYPLPNNRLPRNRHLSGLVKGG